mmetsp:Transcript_14425/g.21672  ORF Transcript_14425/g.21672 Transcript_14425/m.21672 type:complete len:465 (-) Transcript_14425:119-1513(-)
MAQYIAALCLFFVAAVNSILIEEYGAKPNSYDLHTARVNSEAMVNALVAANSSLDRVVTISGGNEYYMLGVYVSDIYDVTIQISGKVIFSDYIPAWDPDTTAQFWFVECHGITVQGQGIVDGQGLKWWRGAYLGLSYRPFLVYFYHSTDIIIKDAFFLNSPRFSIYFKDCADIVVHDITIFIDSSVDRGHGRDSVTYPLNTDGIDIAATNVTIYNCNITNYDDAIVPKPCHSNWKYCICASDIIAYNNNITYSTGLTIGSVPPNVHGNCIRNVTFRDTTMYRPLKAIYIKTNPGEEGSGMIENILYENIVIREALWWTIYIGPQQQNEPNDGSNGTGCNFLFPFIPICPTQPLVTIRNIYFRNVFAVDTVPIFEGPGIILCDPGNPCENIVFDNVQNVMYEGDIDDILAALPIPAPGIVFPTPYRSDDWEFEYLSSQVNGKNVGFVDPEVCFDESCWWDGEAKE